MGTLRPLAYALAFLPLLLDTLSGFCGVILRGLSRNARGDPEDAGNNNTKSGPSHFAPPQGKTTIRLHNEEDDQMQRIEK